MQFDSLAYLFLLVATFVAYAAARSSARMVLLIVASLVFYGAWSVPFLGLVVLSAVLDFVCSWIIAGSRKKGVRRAALAASLIGNLGLLGYFKYANFFAQSIAEAFGTNAATRFVDVVLPPGISFYTFQTMSYTIDVYRGVIAPSKSFGRFFLFVTFFPQLVAGPIERAGRLLAQFQWCLRERVRASNVLVGLRMIAFGMFKKVVIADHCAALVDPVYSAPGSHDPWTLLVATYAFTLQIYCDFSAYSEIARGSARLFGIELMVNFDQPYLVGNVRDFWRRWHISLSEWFRDYVYQPLGGNRKGGVRTLVNLTITMFLSGLWHGAAWTFVVWGLYHGALLGVHALASATPVFRALRRLGAPWRFVSVLFTFHLVVIGWVVFRADTLKGALGILKRVGLAIVKGTAPSGAQLAFFAFVAGFLALSWADRRFGLRTRIDAHPGASVAFYLTVVAACALLGAERGAQFIYFQF